MKEKVLHVSCGGLAFGGVSTVIFSIVENLYDEFDFDCVVFKSRCAREPIFERYGKLYRINAYTVRGRRDPFEILARPFRLYFGIKKICKENHYDVIHVHNNLEEGICLLAAKHAGVPIRIAHSHNTPTPAKRSRLIRIIECLNRLMMRKNATILAGCSDAACIGFFGNCEHRVIYNSVDLSRFSVSEEDLYHRNGKTFVHVGRYTFQKNQEFVLRTFRHIAERDKDYKLYLIGYGEDREKLMRLAVELRLGGQVEFVPGNGADMVSYYRNSDYMIFPSVFEGFGIVLIEAQAMGVRCFVSEAIQKEADVGLLTYLSLEQNPKEWANRILSEIEKGASIDFSALRHNLNKYDSKVIAKEYANLYRGMK